MPGLAVTLIATLPPITSHSPYASQLLAALCRRDDTEMEFLGFHRLYPRWLYPGGRLIDPTARSPKFPKARIRNILAWYNPLMWIWAGATLKGRVVHAQWWSYAVAPAYAAILSLAKIRGKRVVVTMHNVAPHEDSWWSKWLNRFVLRFADHVIVHSSQNRDCLVDQFGWDPRDVTIIPHGILEPFGKRGLSKEAARQLLAIGEDRLVLLLFGNLRPYKGLDVLIRALDIVRREEPNVLLLVAGKPWTDWRPYGDLIERSGLGQYVRAKLDYVPDKEVEAYFIAADLVILPYTHFDAQSGAAMLALPFGKALVVTNVGGLPELVDDGRVVVPPNDPERLAEATLSVLRDADLRRELEEGSFARCISFGWDRIAEETVRVYQQLYRTEATPSGGG